jgi:hypothetical protein
MAKRPTVKGPRVVVFMGALVIGLAVGYMATECPPKASSHKSTSTSRIS